jgi:Zn-dependent peptidase ImmA (M78 family)
MVKLIKDQARDDAEQVLSAYWDDGFPIDPVEIAQKLGITVWTAKLPDDVAGQLVQREGMSAEAYLNDDDGDARQTFTCAHEVGHYWERRQRDDREYSFVDKRGQAPPYDPHEWYADHFAANLLMPASEFRRKVAAGFGASRLANHFGVSRQAVLTRARSLDLDI